MFKDLDYQNHFVVARREPYGWMAYDEGQGIMIVVDTEKGAKELVECINKNKGSALLEINQNETHESYTIRV